MHSDSLVDNVSANRSAEDPFLWLEGATDPRALNWANGKTCAAKATLTSHPLYPTLLHELCETMADSLPTPSLFFVGDRLCRMVRDQEHPHGLLQLASQSRDGTVNTWRTVLDMGALRQSEGVPYELSAEYLSRMALPGTSLCLMQLSVGGSDEMILREFDIERGAFVEGGFALPQTQLEACWLDAGRILVVHTLDGARRGAAGRGANAYLWRRGTAIADATVIAAIEPGESLLTLRGLGHGDDRVGVITRVHDYGSFSFLIVNQSGEVTPALLPRGIKMFPPFATTDSHFLVQLSQPATIASRDYAAESLIAYDVRAGVCDADRASLVYSFAGDEFANDMFYGFAGTRDAFHFILDRRTRRRLLSATADARGWRLEERMVAAAGATLRLGIIDSGADKTGDALIVQQTGYLVPHRYDLLRCDGALISLHVDPPALDRAFTVEIRSATSADGTEIDYYLLAPAGRAGPVPTLMTGYGAFGATLSPGYFDQAVGGRSLKLWLERGGALAMPLIRGGGERGAAWHAAALREHRQRSYDDFIAAAEALVASGFTTPAQLGVFGTSNGGLLAGVVGVQRPDLFSAVVSDAPVLDMLRYHKLGIGGGLTSEYGDPEDPVMRTAILGYSPYQNLQEGAQYPAFLVTVSTRDNRVDPAHARKFVARAEQVGADALLIEEAEGGHTMSNPLTHPELMAMRMTFLISRLMPGEPG